MNRSIVAKIKKGKITLPKALQKDWKEGEVVFMSAPGGFLVKSITRPSLTNIAKRLSKAAKSAGIVEKDVRKAVTWARKKTQESRT